MAKSPDAFRTISEVSAFLETPPHVLRFWESKFPQVKPVKRAGGRRYYRPDDIALLGGIKVLLHEQGMTIRGVQKMLREQGVRHVSGLAPPSLALGWTEGADEAEALEGVIVGPWISQAEERELEDGEDTSDLAAIDGIEPEDLAALGDLAGDADEVPYDAPEDDLDGSPIRSGSGSDAVSAARSGPVADADRPAEPQGSSLIESFLIGTVSRFAAETAAAERHAEPSAPPTLARALDLARRADPVKLRAHADRIAPLLRRLRRLQGDLPGSTLRG